MHFILGLILVVACLILYLVFFPMNPARQPDDRRIALKKSSVLFALLVFASLLGMGYFVEAIKLFAFEATLTPGPNKEIAQDYWLHFPPGEYGAVVICSPDGEQVENTKERASAFYVDCTVSANDSVIFDGHFVEAVHLESRVYISLNQTIMINSEKDLVHITLRIAPATSDVSLPNMRFVFQSSQNELKFKTDGYSLIENTGAVSNKERREILESLGIRDPLEEQAD